MFPNAGRRARPTARLAASIGLLLFVTLSEGLGAQTLTTGAIQVRVRSSDADAAPQALIQLSGHGISRALQSDESGGALANLLRPGRYQVRVEALGHRPRLVLDVPVVPGRVTAVEVELARAAPPVTSVDSVTFESAQARAPAGARAIGSSLLHAIPDLQWPVSGLALLDSRFDPYLGGEGLPGGFTGLLVDGVPFAAASHPWWRRRPMAGLPFSRSSVGYARLLPGPRDIEWPGFAGSLVALETGGPELGAHGLWSDPALWPPDVDGDVPAGASWWAGGTARVGVVPDTTILSVGLDARSTRQVVRAAADDSIAQRIASAVGVPDGTAAGLTSPFAREHTLIAGFARLDWRLNSSLLMVRANLARVGPAHGAPSPASPSPLRGSWLGEEGTDFNAAVQLLTEVSPSLGLEFRGGFAYSSREFGGATLAAGGLPPTHFVDPDLAVGPLAGLHASVKRREFNAAVTGHRSSGSGRLKGGVQLAVAQHRYQHLPAERGRFLLALPDDGGIAAGSYFVTPGPARSPDFGSIEIGAFLQHDWEVVPGLRLTLAGRADREFTALDELPVDPAWAVASGIFERPDPTMDKISGRFRFEWDVARTGATLVSGSMGVRFGRLDPAFVAEGLAGGVETLTHADVAGWPSPPTDGGDPGVRLSVFGPDVQAPRTTRGQLSLRRELGPRTALSVGGGYRKTEYLIRRVDLNRVAFPSGEGPGGRIIFGEPAVQGGLILAEPGSSRRFDAFEVVFGLVPDGWSEYRALNLLLEHRGREGLELFAAYTLSETEDNWWGASMPRPEASLAPGVRPLAAADWREATSDFDVRHRIAAGFRLDLPLPRGGWLSGVYRYRSGLPFTPSFRGVDANADGSVLNDPAFVPSGSEAIAALLDDWGCLSESLGAIVARNACRGPDAHSLDLRFVLGLASVRGRTIQLVVDGLDLTGSAVGIVDEALLLPDAAGEITRSGALIELPYRVNPAFGQVSRGGALGRVLRVGLRLGGGQ